MANLFRKFSKTSASLTLFSSFTHHSPLPPIQKPPPPSSFTHFTHFPKPNVDFANAQKLQFCGDDKLDRSQSIDLFPSFSHGVFLNHAVNSMGYENQHLRIEETDSDDASKIWADSVKKKRKKKMNKHKYKKLRKRLRRKT